MSKLDDVLKLAKKQNYTILLDKDGSRKFCVVPVDKEHIPDMTQRLEDQLKAEGKLGYYVGMIMPVSWEPCMDFLPIYGRTDKYETKWLRRHIEDAVADELKDRGSELYKRILAYEPNVAVIKSKTESIGKLHINEDASNDIDYELSKFEIFDNVEDLFDIADRYNTSSPVSGNWSTEIEHEQQTIADTFNISLEAAKAAMIKILGFKEQDFNKSNSTTPVINHDNDYIKIGKAIAKYYEEISFNGNGIIIYTNNKKALYNEISNALKSIENTK